MKLIRSAIHEFLKDRCGTVAAALAYFTVFSLPAIFVLSIYAAGALFGQQAATAEIERQLGNALSPPVHGQLRQLLAALSRNASRGNLGTFIGFAAIMFAGTRAFSELQRILNRAFNVENIHSGVRGFMLKRVWGFLMIVAISVLLVASMTFGTVVLLISDDLPYSRTVVYLWQILAPGVVLTALVATVFKILPDARMQWRDVWFGAIVTGTLLVSSKYLLSLYLSRSAMASVYGIAGSFALFLLWLYFSSAVLLFGAELTQLRARREGRPAQPTESAVPITKQESPAA
jgi:membrane protein